MVRIIERREDASSNERVLEFTHRRLMAALGRLVDKKDLDGFVVVPGGYGEHSRIIDALNDAARYLHEDFNDEDIEVVRRALANLQIQCSSKSKSAVARAILSKARVPAFAE
jgi:hypothetical protein